MGIHPSREVGHKQDTNHMHGTQRANSTFHANAWGRQDTGENETMSRREHDGRKRNSNMGDNRRSPSRRVRWATFHVHPTTRALYRSSLPRPNETIGSPTYASPAIRPDHCIYFHSQHPRRSEARPSPKPRPCKSQTFPTLTRNLHRPASPRYLTSKCMHAIAAL